MHEAAISKTLNLVYYDQWNVVEDWYTPNVDFIYFTSKTDLEKKIQDILGNWKDYSYIVNNACDVYDMCDVCVYIYCTHCIQCIHCTHRIHCVQC